ncbi:MAG: LPXTG cell wall anchor domain-containing protein [Lachnospiraceae bacterium]|nr:LPXTG cell wall anchor domain-containing protein [Lachnospiraceae bacterium]
MKNTIFVQAANFLHERRDNRRWRAVVICLAIVVVCATALGLSKRGQALTRGEDVLNCRFIVHEHGESCYDENENLICTMADYVFHEHDESCYDADGELICRLPEIKEHVHTDDCFTSEDLLICGKEENAGAEESTENMENPLADDISVEDIETADAVAYADEDIAVYDDTASGGGELICGYAEHTHDGSCYETVVLSSGQDEVRETFICTQTEHTHDDSCLDEEGNLVCAQEEHAHGSDCYEYETIPGEDEVSEILICGQEEHIHGDECYSAGTATDTTDPGSIDTAEPDTAEPGVAEPDSTENTEGVHVHTEACYKTVRKLICGEKAAHIHDDSCYDNNGIAVCGAPYVESVETHVHDKECFKSGDADDMEYSKSYSNDDIVVTAAYKKSANIPVEAKMDVEQIIIEENDLEEYKQRLETVLEQDEMPAMLLSLRFSTDDELFIPEDTISLTVEFLKDNIYAEGDMAKVASITENSAEAIISANIDDTHSVTFDVDELTDLAFIAYEEKEARTLTYEGADYIVTVALGEETLVPEDAELVVEQITEENDPEAYEACYGRLEEAEGMLDENEMPALLLDMGIYAEGNEIVPDETMDVTVQFLNREIYFEGDAVKAAHLTADGIELLAASAIDEEVSTTFTVDALAEFAFITDGDIRTLTAEGEDFIVAVRFGPSAKIPEDAQLVAKRITEENDPEQFTTREDQLQDEIEDEIIALGALFDISFYDAEGMEIEPQDVVDVKIQLLDKKDVEEADSVRVAHFVEDEETAEESIEIIKDADVSKDGDGSLSTTFQTESFSLYAITVNSDVINQSTLRKAIKLAQQGDSGLVRLMNDIVFTKTADEGDADGAMSIDAGKSVTLDLNGYTITVDPSNGGSVTLFNIRGSLNIKDSSSGKEVTEKLIGVSSKDMDNTSRLDYDDANNHLNFMTCYITKSDVIDPSTGATREDVYEYTVSGHGAIVGSKQNESPLLWVTGQGTLDIDDGVIVGGNGKRAVEISGSGNTAVADLRDCYLVNNIITNIKDVGGGAVYCGNGGTINVHDKAVISGNMGWQGGAIYVGASTINMYGGYITNNETAFGANKKEGEQANYGGGGGILLRNASIHMEGGFVTGNRVYTGGGGISIEGDTARERQIVGGFISSNYCLGSRGDGAGIALYDKSSIEINAEEGKKVYITNNEVFADGDWGGAGMFVGENSTANLYDTLITNNLAEGFGGGLSGCSTGRIINRGELDGAAIFDNTALGSKKSGYSSSKKEDKTYTENNPAFWEFDSDGRYYFQDCFTALYTELDNTMLGNGSENWDGSIDGERIDTTANYWSSSYIAGLTAYPTDEGKNNAMNAANVYINGNHSVVHGGGIMCNGIMVIGEHPHEIEITSAMKLKAKKKLVNANDASGKPLEMDEGQFSFTIYSDEECTKLITTGTNDENGNISFVDFLKFDLKNDFPEETEGTYIYYIKEDDAAQNPLNIEIISDDTLYRMTVTVTKSDHGKVAGSNIDKYIDDITHVLLEKKDGSNWVTVYENTNRLTNEKHPVELNLSSSNGEALFTNTKSGVLEIEVEKRWNYKEGYEPGGESGTNDIVWVSVGLFNGGRELEGIDPNYKRLVLNAENGWKGSWKNLSLEGSPEDYIVMEVEVGHADGRVEPADWLFAPTFEYSNEKDGVGKVTITNTPKTNGLEFVKKGYDGKFVYGAKFEIYMMDKDDNEPDINKKYSNPNVLWFSHVSDGYERIDYDDITDVNSARTTTTLSTNVEGKLRIANLWWGSFLIREVKAPVGYKPVHDHIVDYSGGTATQKMLCVLPNGEIKQNGVDGYMCSVFEKIPASELVNTPEDRGSDYFDYVSDVLIWKMIDPEDQYELPETGGKGTIYISILGGLSFFGIAALMYMTFRRRRNGLRR